MGGVLGSAAVFTVDTFDWTPYLDNVSMNRVREVLDAASIDVPTDVVLNNEAITISIGGKLTQPGWAKVQPVFAATTPHAIEFGPLGNTSGYPKITSAAVYMGQFQFTPAAKGLVAWSGQMTVVGGVTPTTY